jgi:Zn-dependent protease with chaperone function
MLQFGNGIGKVLLSDLWLLFLVSATSRKQSFQGDRALAELVGHQAATEQR